MNDHILYSFHADAVKELEASGEARYNWLKTVEFKAADLKSMIIVDAETAAGKWRSTEVPKDFYFTHAKYYQDGVRHIINELKSKATSRRALYSLINQSDISRSEDSPIPSFLTMQCQINNGILVCTCTFRALEVGSFLRVNLEEIRQNLLEITAELPGVVSVLLTIFAFTAYIQKDMHPLVKPEIEYLEDYEILPCLVEGAQEDPARYLAKLLRNAQGALSVVPAHRLRKLKDILGSLERIEHVKLDKNIANRLTQLYPALDVSIGAAEDLSQKRKIGSHGDQIEAATRHYKDSLEVIAKVLEK